MQKHLVSAIISVTLVSLIALAGCQKQFYYRFPQESELKGIPPDSLHWKYTGATISQVPVLDNKGKLVWLNVTPETKLEVTTLEGDTYRFLLQSITVANSDAGLFGSSAQWTGYETRQHATRTVLAREIAKVMVVTNSPATSP